MGQEVPPGCIAPPNAWVCAVLPIDSGSENDGEEEEDSDDRPEHAENSANGAEVASNASTCTPLAQTMGTPDGGHTVSTISPSENRSDPSWVVPAVSLDLLCLPP